MKIDRAAGLEAIARARAKHFSGLGVPKSGNFPRFAVNPTSFADAWLAMRSVADVKHERHFANLIFFTESGFLAAFEPNMMAIRANAALVPGAYGADGKPSEANMPEWEDSIPQVKKICKPDFSVMPSPADIPTLAEREDAVGLVIGGVRTMFSLRIYAQVWMFLARANQLSPMAAARDSEGSVVFWTPFACAVAMPLRGGFDGEDVSLSWHSAGPAPKGYSSLPRVWGERRAAERDRWQSREMSEWRLQKRLVKTADGEGVSCSEEKLAAIHDDHIAAHAPPEFPEDSDAAAEAGIPPVSSPVAAEAKPGRAPRKAKKTAKKKAAKKGGRKK